MLGGTALALLLASAPARPAGDGRLVFGTKSVEAAAAAREAMTVLVRTSDLEAVETLAQKAVDADREFAFARCLLALAFERTFREAAPVQWERAKELAPNAPAGEQRWIAALLPQEDNHPDADKLNEAVEAWRKLAAEYPQEPLAFVMLGHAHGRRHLFGGRDPADREAGHEAAEMVLSLDPKSSSMHRGLAEYSMEKGDFAHACEHFEWAREAQGGPVSCKDGVAVMEVNAYLFDAQPAAARAIVSRCRDEYERAASVPGVQWNFIGRVLLETGDAPGGLAAYEKGREWIERLTWTEDEQALRQVWIGRYHHGRGRCLAKMGRHAEAWAQVELVKKMIDAGGNRGQRHLPAFHYLAGYVKLEAGELEAALEHLRQAGTETDNFRTLLLARAYDRLGRVDEARSGYRAIVDDTNDLRLERALAYAEAKTRLAALDAAAATRR
jgi:tetratricopeptide (TPR) repeat protein